MECYFTLYKNGMSNRHVETTMKVIIIPRRKVSRYVKDEGLSQRYFSDFSSENINVNSLFRRTLILESVSFKSSRIDFREDYSGDIASFISSQD